MKADLCDKVQESIASESNIESRLAPQTSAKYNFFGMTEKILYTKAANLYFTPKHFERWKDGQIYKYLNVDVLKKFVPTSGSHINKLLHYHPIKDASDKDAALIAYQRSTRIFEAGHIAVFSLFAHDTMNALMCGNYKYALKLVVINATINVYPIMLQRYNRAKIYNALENKNKEY